jgi:hypothetical protein
MTLRRTPLKRVSTKRAAQMKEYTRLRAEFMAARPVCEVWLSEMKWKMDHFENGHPFYTRGNLIVPAEHLLAVGAPRSEECHHIHGRGKYYLDTSTWMAVSAEAHRRIHNRPGQARAKGWLK